MSETTETRRRAVLFWKGLAAFVELDETPRTGDAMSHIERLARREENLAATLPPRL